MINKVLRELTAAYAHKNSRYECLQAEGADLKKSFEICAEVFGEELKRSRVSSKSLSGTDFMDGRSIHLLCRDKKDGSYAGTIRMTRASEIHTIPDYEKEYHLGYFPARFLPHVVIVSRLAVRKKHRRGIAGLLLAMKCYEAGLDTLGCKVSVINCEPGLFPFYRFLGYKPLAPVFVSNLGGYRLPLYLILHDYEHLNSVRSPFYQLARERGFPKETRGLEWQAMYQVKHGTISTGYTIVEGAGFKDYHSQITEDLSEKGRREILARASHIRCRPGDTVMAKGDGGRNIGFVKKGALEVRDDGHVLAVMGEGDIFGEIAYVLDVPRTADLIATTPDTEIVLLGLSSISRLSSVKDQAVVWRNLSRILARRLIYKKRS